MAPASGQEMRQRIRDRAIAARAQAKTAAGNIESKARELAEEVKEDLNTAAGSVSRRRKVAPAGR
jgi:gas vesicle protein